MKSFAVCALLAPVVAGGGLALCPQGPASATALPSPSLNQAAVVALTVAAANPLPTQSLAATKPAPVKAASASPATAGALELHPAIQQGKITAQFKGNGRDRMQATLTNLTSAPLSVRVAPGQMLEAGKNSVIVVRTGEAMLEPGKSIELVLQTAATRTGNKVGEAAYQISFGVLPQMAPLLAYAQEHAELSTASLQTAVLALVENLPLSAVAKFSAAGADLPTRFDTTAFKADTGDILQALLALRAVGARDSDLALTVDPQLKIEAMIDPATHATAMRYYGISTETEWNYWKTELLSGEPTTRHYALYGIARFYPEVALEMLPKWARETKMQNVFRISAIQAMADTLRPEALPILQRLSDELGAQTELGRTATTTAQYLSAHLAKMAAERATVAYRTDTSSTPY